MNDPAEQFRASPMIKEIDALFADICGGADRNSALHRATQIRMKLGGDDGRRLIENVYEELRKRER
jgi:hypothetical protein